MKLVKTAGKDQIRMSKKEWASIGKKAGWIKEAKIIDVEYFAGFNDVKKTQMRLDPGEDKDDILRRLKHREKTQDITITKYFPVSQKRKKQFSLKDQAHQRELQRIKERRKRQIEKDQTSVPENQIQQLLTEIETDEDESGDEFLDKLRSRKVANQNSTIKILKTASGKYKLNKQIWASIGKKAGWLGKEIIYIDKIDEVWKVTTVSGGRSLQLGEFFTDEEASDAIRKYKRKGYEVKINIKSQPAQEPVESVEEIIEESVLEPAYAKSNKIIKEAKINMSLDDVLLIIQNIDEKRLDADSYESRELYNFLLTRMQRLKGIAAYLQETIGKLEKFIVSDGSENSNMMNNLEKDIKIFSNYNLM